MTHIQDVLNRITGGVVVSCQAASGTPLAQPTIIAALAKAAELGGAAGLRIEGVNDIKAVREASDLPVIGLFKAKYEGSDVYITPTSTEASALIDAGADIIALDATARTRPRESLEELVDQVRDSGSLLMADIATHAEGIRALELGFDIIGTTLQGYTAETAHTKGPAFELIRSLTDAGAWVIAEGRIWTPEDVAKCYEHGAMSVVVGGAVTDPISITRRLTRGVPEFVGVQ